MFPIFTNPPDWWKALSNGVKNHLFKLKTSKISPRAPGRGYAPTGAVLCCGGKKLFLGEGGGEMIEMHNIYPCIKIHQLLHDCQYVAPEPKTWPISPKHFRLQNSETYSGGVRKFIEGCTVGFVQYGYCLVGRVFRGGTWGFRAWRSCLHHLNILFLKGLRPKLFWFQIEVSTSVGNCGGYKWVSFDMNFIERVRERQGERKAGTDNFQNFGGAGFPIKSLD